MDITLDYSEKGTIGEKRVEETLEAWFKTVPEYQDRTLCAGQIIDAYLVFEKSGFEDVRALEEKATTLAVKLAENVETVKQIKLMELLKV